MSVKYPIAEIFTSPQGEGQYAGTLMTFIRFAGCNVGKPYPANNNLLLQPYQECCTNFDGTKFACDTNYQRKSFMTVEEIVQQIDSDIGHVCFTGGEPLLHDLEPLRDALDTNILCHIETSGTKVLPADVDMLWVTVSPKQGYLMDSIVDADELKLLVGRDFDKSCLSGVFAPYLDKVWLQPINFEQSIIAANLAHCVELQKEFKKVRISVQLHKIIGCR